MPWLHRLRLKLLAFVAALVLAGVAVASVTTVPLWGVVGMTVAAVAVAVNTLGSRLSHPTCLGCGRDISAERHGAYGVMCPGCGTINQPRR
jgi:hypothetical protein